MAGLARVSWEIDHALSFCTRSMGVAHWGQRKQTGWAAKEVLTADACGLGFSNNKRWQRGKSVAAILLAMKPKERMRTKPRGRTCSRKRRKNSSADRVIFLFLFPWA